MSASELSEFNLSVKFWHLFNFDRCFGNTNCQQYRLTKEIMSFWNKFKAFLRIRYQHS